MHHLASLLSTFSQKYRIKACHIARVSVLVFVFSYFPYSFKSFQIRNNACCRYIVFNYFSEVLNRFKYRHTACFRCTLVLSISLQLQIVLNTIRMHALETLFSKKRGAWQGAGIYISLATPLTMFCHILGQVLL